MEYPAREVSPPNEAFGSNQRLRGTRVLLLVQNLPVPFDRRVWQEAIALHGAGADVTVVSPGDERFPPTVEDIAGVHVYRYSAPPEAIGVLGYAREYALGLRAMSSAVKQARRRRGGFDVIHFCNPPDLLFLVARRHRGRGSRRAKLIFDQHDLGPELVRAKHFPLSRVFEWVARRLESQSFRSADSVVSTNESYRHVALTRGRKAPDRVTVVRSGPSSGWITPAEPDWSWHRGRKWLIGYVGVMGRQEGIEYLLEALRVLVRERGVDAQLALAGSGPDIARLRTRTKELGLEAHVDFLGRVTDEDLRSLLSSADVCVNSDEVNDLNDMSTMNKILEYMALGRPIVQFDVTEGRFSAQDSSRYALPNNAHSFADEIQWVFDHPAEAAAMGRAGKARFERELNWERQAESLVNAYSQLLSARR